MICQGVSQCMLLDRLRDPWNHLIPCNFSYRSCPTKGMSDSDKAIFPLFVNGGITGLPTRNNIKRTFLILTQTALFVLATAVMEYCLIRAVQSIVSVSK